jgi:flagellar biosynthesis/type III secretory pathway protein FliH
MGKKQLILASLLILLAGVAAQASAQDIDRDDSTLEMRRTSSCPTGFDQGYRSGFNEGKDDLSTGADMDMQGNLQEHQEGAVTVSSCSADDFNMAFQSGFERGYLDGYHGRDMATVIESDVQDEEDIAIRIPPGADVDIDIDVDEGDTEVVEEVAEAPAEVVEEVTEVPEELARADVDTQENAYRSGYDIGYKKGYEGGKSDHMSGADFDHDDAPGYGDYKSSYDSSLGKKSKFKDGYDDGFELGYEHGYAGLASQLVTPPTPEQLPAAAVEEPEIEEEAVVEEAPVQEQPQEEIAEMPEEQLPEALPRTASGLPFLALSGLFAIAVSLLFRFRRTHS